MSDPIYRQILSSSFCSCTVQPGCDLIGICVYLCTFVIFSAIKITPVRWKKYSTRVYQTHNSQTQFHLLSTFSKSEYELYVKKQMNVFLLHLSCQECYIKSEPQGCYNQYYALMMLYLYGRFISMANFAHFYIACCISILKPFLDI